MQGNPDSHRRNYSGLLQDVAASPALVQDTHFELDIFAWKQLDPVIVPANISSKIVYKHLVFPVRFNPFCMCLLAVPVAQV